MAGARETSIRTPFPTADLPPPKRVHAEDQAKPTFRHKRKVARPATTKFILSIGYRPAANEGMSRYRYRKLIRG